MPRTQITALRNRFGLSAVDAPPVVFSPTPQGKVWGGLGNAEQQADARAAFVEWLQSAYPEAVDAMLEALGFDDLMAARPDGLGQVEQKSWVDQLMTLTQTVLPAYLQYDQQKEILKVQLDRAREGLPPLEYGEYAPSMQIGLDPETVARLADEAQTRAASVFRTPWPWVALAGVGALVLLNMRPRRRRR